MNCETVEVLRNGIKTIVNKEDVLESDKTYVEKKVQTQHEIEATVLRKNQGHKKTAKR